MDRNMMKQAKARLLKETEEHRREAEGARKEIEKYRRKLQKAEVDLQLSACERDYEMQLIRQYDNVMSKRKEELARNNEHEKQLRAGIERATRDAGAVTDKTRRHLDCALRIYNRVAFSDTSLSGGQSSRELRQAISDASKEANELKARLDKAREEKRKLEAELQKVPFHEVAYSTKKRLLHELAVGLKAMRKRLMALKMENHELQMGIASSQ